MLHTSMFLKMIIRFMNIMIDTEIEQGNRIVKKDITDHSYTIEGNTKGDRYFYSKATCKKTYERDIILTVKLEYTDSKKEEARAIICLYNNDKIIAKELH